MQRIFAGQQQADLTTTAVVVGSPRLPSGLRPGPGGDAQNFLLSRLRGRLGGGATILIDHPDRVVVTANVDHPSLLLLADTMSPGWQAKLDGRDVPILSADGCLRAVALPDAGAHAVVFTYRPTSVLLGLYVSLLTMGCLVGAAVNRALKPRV
jgi:hypothetical protein